MEFPVRLWAGEGHPATVMRKADAPAPSLPRLHGEIYCPDPREYPLSLFTCTPALASVLCRMFINVSIVFYRPILLLNVVYKIAPLVFFFSMSLSLSVQFALVVRISTPLVFL